MLKPSKLLSLGRRLHRQSHEMTWIGLLVWAGLAYCLSQCRGGSGPAEEKTKMRTCFPTVLCLRSTYTHCEIALYLSQEDSVAVLFWFIGLWLRPRKSEISQFKPSGRNVHWNNKTARYGEEFFIFIFFLTETIPKRCQLGVIYSAHKLTRPNIG